MFVDSHHFTPFLVRSHSFCFGFSFFGKTHDIYSLCLKLKLPRAHITILSTERFSFCSVEVMDVQTFTRLYSRRTSNFWCAQNSNSCLRENSNEKKKFDYVQNANFSVRFLHEIQTKIIMLKFGYISQNIFFITATHSNLVNEFGTHKILQPNKINWKLQFIRFARKRQSKKEKYFHNFIWLDQCLLAVYILVYVHFVE